MSSDIETLAQQFREQGPRQFAAWNSDAFEAFVEGPVADLVRQLKWQDKDSPDPAVAPNYLRMVYEGIGAGWLNAPDRDVPAPTFLAHCLQLLVPYNIGSVPQAKRSHVMQQVWNLGEGLAKEPLWLNQFAITQTNWSTDIRKLEQHLTKILAPVLSPAPPSNWMSKYQLTVLDFRERFPAFVPGRMYLASPALLCVADRIDPQQNAAILLRKSGKSEVLGAVGRLPEYVETFDPPTVEPNANDIMINSRRVDTPLICSPRQTLCVTSGFVAVTAEDSQRLWLVDAV